MLSTRTVFDWAHGSTKRRWKRSLSLASLSLAAASQCMAAQPYCPPTTPCPPGQAPFSPYRMEQGAMPVMPAPQSPAMPGSPSSPGSPQSPSNSESLFPNSTTPNSQSPNSTTPNTNTPNSQLPQSMAPNVNQPAQQPQQNFNNSAANQNLASNTSLAQGAAAGNSRSTPGMVGDFFGATTVNYTYLTNFAAYGLLLQGNVPPGIGAPQYLREVDLVDTPNGLVFGDAQRGVFFATSASQTVNTLNGVSVLNNVALYDGATFDGTLDGVTDGVNDSLDGFNEIVANASLRAPFNFAVAPVAVSPSGIYNPNGNQDIPNVIVVDPDGPGPLTSGVYAIYEAQDITVVTNGGGFVGRQKLVENTSPLPQDRVFFNYSYFSNTPGFSQGVNVNRFSPGFEKRFMGGRSSFEFRIPIATTVDSTIDSIGPTNLSHVEIGNVTTYLKTIVKEWRDTTMTAGLGIQIPTADDLKVQLNGQDIYKLRNESVHLLPFLGLVHAPQHRRYFAQLVTQFDFDVNGNSVFSADPTAALFQGNDAGRSLQLAGRSQDAAFWYQSLNAGYWLYRSCRPHGLTGVAPMVELHYNRSLQDQDVITTDSLRANTGATNVDVLNGVAGLNMTFSQNKSLTAAYSTPLTGGSDRQFDGEFRLTFNWFFGGSNAYNQFGGR